MCSGLRGHDTSKDNSLVASAAGKLLKVTPVSTISFHFYLFDFRKLIHFRLIKKNQHKTSNNSFQKLIRMCFIKLFILLLRTYWKMTTNPVRLEFH